MKKVILSSLVAVSGVGCVPSFSVPTPISSEKPKSSVSSTPSASSTATPSAVVASGTLNQVRQVVTGTLLPRPTATPSSTPSWDYTGGSNGGSGSNPTPTPSSTVSPTPSPTISPSSSATPVPSPSWSTVPLPSATPGPLKTETIPTGSVMNDESKLVTSITEGGWNVKLYSYMDSSEWGTFTIDVLTSTSLMVTFTLSDAQVAEGVLLTNFGFKTASGKKWFEDVTISSDGKKAFLTLEMGDLTDYSVRVLSGNFNAGLNTGKNVNLNSSTPLTNDRHGGLLVTKSGS